MPKPQLWILTQEMLKPVSTVLASVPTLCQTFVVGEPIAAFRVTPCSVAPCWVVMKCPHPTFHSYASTDSPTESVSVVPLSLGW